VIGSQYRFKPRQGFFLVVKQLAGIKNLQFDILDWRLDL
jgi:hypothetical protein